MPSKASLPLEKKQRMKTASTSFIISASLGTGCYRHIMIPGTATLEDLSCAILWAFDFDNDHAHAFFMDNKAWSNADCYYIDGIDDEDECRHTCDYRLEQVMSVERKFLYLFDFGEDWQFHCKTLRQVEECVIDDGGKAVARVGENVLIKVIRETGASPSQYDDQEEDDGSAEPMLMINSHQSPPPVSSRQTHPTQGLLTEVSAALPDALYDLALAFKKTKLWMKLYDSQMFAVRHSDGTLGYCCAMGRMGAHLALAVYPGDEGMDSYRTMGVDYDGMDPIDAHEHAFLQNCVMVSFQNKSALRDREVEEVTAYITARGLTLRGKNAFPQFERFRPYHFPWRLDDEADQTHLAEALEAAIEVSEKLTLTAPEMLGFTEGEPYDRAIPLIEKANGEFVWSTIQLPPEREITYVSPQITNDISLAKLSRCKRRGGEWACDIFMHMDAMSDETTDGDCVKDPIAPPYFPYLLLAVDNASGMVLGVQIAKNLKDDAAGLCDAMVDIALSAGKPTKLLVCNQRAYAFFEQIAPQLGAKLVMKKKIPMLQDAKEDMAEQLDDHDGCESELDDLMELLSEPAVYRDLPDEVLVTLQRMIKQAVLPSEIMRLVERECRKRGMWAQEDET